MHVTIVSSAKYLSLSEEGSREAKAIFRSLLNETGRSGAESDEEYSQTVL